MAKARLILDTRSKSQSKITGLFPIAVRVFHKKPRIIRLIYYTSPKGWNEKDGCLKKSVNENSNLDCDLINKELFEKITTARRLINDLGENIDNITVDTLVDEIKKLWEDQNQTEIKQKYEDCITLSEFGKVLVKRKLKANKPRTAKWYQDCIKAFTDQNNGKDLKLSEVTVRFLKDFEAEHRSRGNVTNTISNYVRGVRAIYNAAINEDEYYPDRNVFTRYKIPTSKRVKKKALSKESILKVMQVEYPTGSTLWHTKNYFITMFMARGMNFIDLAKLRVKNIHSGYIFYGRSKTDDPISVKIVPALQQVLDNYIEGKRPNDFVFPIGNDGSPKMFKKYRNDISSINKNLAILAKDAGIDEKLTTYYLRHSWATIAKHLGVSIPMISDALGHQSVATTEIYLKSFTNESLDEANQLVVG